MREIIFRGQRKDNKEWVEGYLVRCGEDLEDCFIFPPAGVLGLHDNDYGLGFYNAVEVILETVGQYTGLKDKNGRMIFEGDVCCNTKTGEIVSIQWHGTMAGYIWHKRKGNSYLFDFGALFRAFDKYEVIGNIHDNPELLE